MLNHSFGPYEKEIEIGIFSVDIPIYWTEDNMVAAILYHKYTVPKGGFWFNTEAHAALDFAIEGYSGSNPEMFRHGPFGCSLNTTTQDLTKWHWQYVQDP